LHFVLDRVYILFVQVYGLVFGLLYVGHQVQIIEGLFCGLELLLLDLSSFFFGGVYVLVIDVNLVGFFDGAHFFAVFFY